MGSGRIVYSDECDKSNLLSPTYQRELLPHSLNNKSKELWKQRGKYSPPMFTEQLLCTMYYSGHWESTLEGFNKIMIWPDKHTGSVWKMDYKSTKLEAGSPFMTTAIVQGRDSDGLNKDYTMEMVIYS